MSYDFIPAAKPIIGDDERAAVDAVLATGMLAQGQQVAEFEKEFSEVLLDGRSSVAVNSGTSGLHLGLLAAGVKAGDEVIVPSFTFAATGNSVALAGATPVFADIELDHSRASGNSLPSGGSTCTRTRPRPTVPASTARRSERSASSRCSACTRRRT